ncbi:hypothetical protein CKA32_004139 [Geitlerinema sp. FC II]|nr:hypothetical protein CKA32_004139 [Geitlerinema sp. FC II]
MGTGFGIKNKPFDRYFGFNNKKINNQNSSIFSSCQELCI